MSIPTPIAEMMTRARGAASRGELMAAEAVLRQVVARRPGHPPALAALGQLALDGGAMADAEAWFAAAANAEPENPQHALDHAFTLLAQNNWVSARQTLNQLVVAHPDCYAGWLMLGQVCDVLEDRAAALTSFYRAVNGAQRAGQWLDESSTPTPMLDAVMQAISRVRTGRRELFFSSYEAVRQRHGSAALRRVDQALKSYLKEAPVEPRSPHQRPRFFFFPGLPEGPYHDPMQQPWAVSLLDAYPAIRSEALKTLAHDSHFENFINFRGNMRIEDYLRGTDAKPAWEAYFFYRHGKRYDDNHTRCPHTSVLLESINLCIIDSEAPEVCFSVLTPGTEILPHHGVSNIRMVMHLPLLVPSGCALNVFGGGHHHWREGELVMFDDTYRHEAWNRSTSTRIVLLMDCWNPYLDTAEREAVRHLVEMIGGFGRTGSG